MTDDADATDDLNPVAYLKERYGVEVERLSHNRDEPPLYDYRVQLPALHIEFEQGFNEHEGEWTSSIYVDDEFRTDFHHYTTLPAAARAADDAARDLLAETAQKLPAEDYDEIMSPPPAVVSMGGDAESAPPVSRGGDRTDGLQCRECGSTDLSPVAGARHMTICKNCSKALPAIEQDSAERLEVCGGGEVDGGPFTQPLRGYHSFQCRDLPADFSALADRAERHAAQVRADADVLGYLASRYGHAEPVHPAPRFDALDVAYEVRCGLGAVRFAESDGRLYWRRVAVDEQTGYRGGDWTLEGNGLRKVCEAAEDAVFALEEGADRE